jgi:hypothetical protein
MRRCRIQTLGALPQRCFQTCSPHSAAIRPCRLPSQILSCSARVCVAARRALPRGAAATPVRCGPQSAGALPFDSARSTPQAMVGVARSVARRLAVMRSTARRELSQQAVGAFRVKHRAVEAKVRHGRCSACNRNDGIGSTPTNARRVALSASRKPATSWSSYRLVTSPTPCPM